MKEIIDQKKELLESGKFNEKFSKNLLEHGAKNLQGIYLVICIPDVGRSEGQIKMIQQRIKIKYNHHSSNFKKSEGGSKMKIYLSYQYQFWKQIQYQTKKLRKRCLSSGKTEIRENA